MRLQFGTNGTAATGIAPPGLDESARTGNRALARPDTTGGGDRITLSATSGIINRFAVSRSERIEQLSAAVGAGTYRVSSLDLSRRLVSFALGQ